MRAASINFLLFFWPSIECCEYESETKEFCFSFPNVEVANLKQAKKHCRRYDSIPLEIYTKELEAEVVRMIASSYVEEIRGKKFILNLGIRHGFYIWLSSKTFAKYVNLWDSPIANITDAKTFLMVLGDEPYWERSTHSDNTPFHLICIQNVTMTTMDMPGIDELINVTKATVNIDSFERDLLPFENETIKPVEGVFSTYVNIFGVFVIMLQMVFMLFVYMGVKHVWNAEMATPEILPSGSLDNLMFNKLARTRFSSSVTPDASYLKIDDNLMTAT